MQLPVARMVDPEKLERLSALTVAYVKAQEEIILQQGMPLSPRQVQDAQLAGVQDTARVRILIVDRILAPENEELAEAAAQAQVITHASRAVTMGHGIIIRADRWQDRELILHQLVHVAQCERFGGPEKYVPQYLSDRSTCADFSLGSLEDEARNLARNICAQAEK